MVEMTVDDFIGIWKRMTPKAKETLFWADKIRQDLKERLNQDYIGQNTLFMAMCLMDSGNVTDFIQEHIPDFTDEEVVLKIFN